MNASLAAGPPVCCLLSLCLALSLPSRISASYEEDLLPLPRPEVLLPAHPAPGLIQLGAGPASAPKVRSRGRNIPFVHALPLLLPADWRAAGADGAPGTPVSWSAGERLTDLLARLARESGCSLRLDWSEKRLSVDPGGAGLSPAAAPISPQTPPPGEARSQAQTGSPAPAPEEKTNPCAPRAPEEPWLPAADHGRVLLTRGMELSEAARLAGIPAKRLSAWNGLGREDSYLPKGYSLRLSRPEGGEKTRPPAPARAAGGTPLPASGKAGSAPSAEKTRMPAAETPGAAGGLASPVPAPAAAKGPVPVSAPPSAPSGAGSGESPAEKTAKPACAQPSSAPGLSPAASGSCVSPASPGAPSAAASWRIVPGRLRPQLTAWAAREGWRLVWHADTDLDLEADAVFSGTFSEAVRALFEGLRASGSPLTARLWHGNTTLSVEDR